MMKPLNTSEPDFTSLGMHDAGANRIERIRARCLAALEYQQQRDRKHRPFSNAWQRWLEPALALALSALYLAAAVGSSLHLLLSRFQ